MFHAAYALGIRPPELSPSRKPCSSRSRCSPAVRPLALSLAAISWFPSRTVTTRSRSGLVPLEKGLFVYRFPDDCFSAGGPSASSIPNPRRLDLDPVSPLGSRAPDPAGHGTGPSSPQACARVRSTSAPKRYSSWKSVLAASGVVPSTTADALLGFYPSRAFSLSALGLGTSPAVARHRAPAASAFRCSGRPPSSPVLFVPRGEPNDPSGPQSLRQRKDWLDPLGPSCSLGVSHLLGVSRQFGFDTTLDYRFSSGETPRHRFACTPLRAVLSAD